MAESMEVSEVEAVESPVQLQLAQQWFSLSASDDVVPDKTTLRQSVLDSIKKDKMVPFYRILCDQFGWMADESLVESMNKDNEEELKKIEARILDAEENLGDTEIKEARLAKAEFYRRIGDKEKALEGYTKTLEKTVGVGSKLDVVFSMMRVGFFFSDTAVIKANIDKAKSLLEEGGDWERRNRLKVYEALSCMMNREFEQSARLFLDCLATFTCHELMTYQQLVLYTVLTAIVALDRVTLRAKVVHSPEILSVIRDIAGLKQFLDSLFHCQYVKFFQAFVDVIGHIRSDRYLAPHSRYLVREMRIVAYSQFLESYKSVTLASMADSMGLSTQFLDSELSQFISSGRLHCKIDKVAGIVESNRPDARNALYQQIIKQGDHLLNRVQRLSRVIDV